MINFNNVSKEYNSNRGSSNIKELFSFKPKDKKNKNFLSLNNISFHIKPGQCVGLIGKNGSGKSTLLKIISSITLPSSGVITINGNVSSLLEVGAGFHPDLTGRENVLLSGAILGLKSIEMDLFLPIIEDFADIGHFFDQPIKTYSSGMTMRLAFAIGANLPSEVLLIDEALAVGDADFQHKCLNKINQLKSEGKTILFVSHDIEQIKTICDRGIVLSQGNIVIDDNITQAIETYLESCI